MNQGTSNVFISALMKSRWGYEIHVQKLQVLLGAYDAATDTQN